MNNQCGDDHDEATVMGFEVPRSPDSSYNNVYPGKMMHVTHLHRALLSYPASINSSGSLSLPGIFTLKTERHLDH
ncbi:hypothetical protein HRI_002074500 [Hibiscus trionum]|uniref:Uncharacterized protein n=1 Tax=Hibiscus trionum TaxID=183268 RepID=A0A9W7HV63_HIBTR|nr:hypothetical protein HRI_002074500 [Hibiscus trionum]